MSPDMYDMETVMPKDLPEDPHVSYIPKRKDEVDTVDEDYETATYSRLMVSFAPGAEKGKKEDGPKSAGVSEEATAPIPSPKEPKPEEKAAYVFRRQIGEGGFGEVWEATQNSLGRVVAIKRLREEAIAATGKDKEKARLLRRSFREEALTSAQLDHPNIVPVYDLGMDSSGRAMLVMKMVHGSPWNKMLERDLVELSVEEHLARHIPILLDVAQAVAFAHSRGIVHRDLKPAQVMVGEYGEVLLMDWGFAVVFDKEALTADGAEMTVAPTPETASNPAGTLAFMAPEQTARTAARIGPWTDVYLLGGMLYQVLTGRPPRRGGGSAQLFMQASQGQYTPLEEAAPRRFMPQDLIELVTDCLQPQIGDRPPVARAFVARLEAYLSGASHRNESISITARLRSELPKARRDYRLLGEIVAQLGRALTLWTGNEEAVGLREEALTQFATAALKHGDLTLARVQAERKEQPRERADLLKKIGKAEKAQGRQRAFKRILITTIFLLLAGGLAGSLYSYNRIEQERDVVEDKNSELVAASAREAAAREKAEGARGDADGLIEFMLDDLASQLEPLGRLDILNSAGQKALDYFGALEPQVGGEDAQEVRLRKAETLNLVGRVLEGQGSVREAAKSYEEAARLATDLSRSSSFTDQKEATFVLGASQVNLGRTLHMMGGSEGGEQRLLSGRNTLRELAESDPSNLEYARALARAIQGLVDAGKAAGRDTAVVEGYRAELRQALNRIADIEAEGAPSPIERVEDLRKQASASLEGGDPAGAELKLGEALAAIQDWLAGEPEEDWRMREQEAGIRTELGQVFVTNGDLAEGADEFAKSLTGYQELSKRDETNTEWKLGAAKATARTAFVLEGRNDLAGAAQAYNEALAEIRNLIQGDPVNALWRREAAKCHMGLARLARVREDSAGARRQYSDALALLRGVPMDGGEAMECELRLREIMLDEGDYSGAARDSAQLQGVLRSQVRANAADRAARRNLARLMIIVGVSRWEGFGEEDRARDAWNEAASTLRPLAASSSRWDDLQLLARARLLAGQIEDAKATLEKLREQGYDNPALWELAREKGAM